MSVTQLTTQNFTSNGETLGISYAGNVMVFFQQDGCPGCAAVFPIFERLAASDSRVSFAAIDLKYNRDVIAMSRNTSTAIQKVPSIILYANGRPHARFKGAPNYASLVGFIADVVPTIQAARPTQQPSFVQQQRPAYIQPQNNAPRQQYNGGQQQQAVHPSMQQQCDPDDEDCLMVPKEIIPHNMPWEAEFKKLNGSI